MKLISSDGICISQVMSSNNPLLLSYNNNYILVDTGIKEKCDAITERLAKLLKGYPLKALIINHAHYEHVENVAAIKEKFNPKIIVHEREAEYVEKGESSPLPSWNYVKGEKINNCPSTKWYFTPVQADILVDKRLDLAEYAFNGYILWTPGHSPGSLSIIINDEIAIVGDALGGMEKKPYAKKINIASEEAKNSWETLIALNCKKYITTHSGILDHEELLSKYNNYCVEAMKILK